MKCSRCPETHPDRFSPGNHRCRPCQAAYMRERRPRTMIAGDALIDALERDGGEPWRYRLKPGRPVRYDRAVRICLEAGLDPHLVGV